MVGSLRTSLVALLFLALALSGCAETSTSDRQDDIPEGAFDDLDLETEKGLGIIRGVVFDDSIRPVEDAEVFLVVAGEIRATQTTDKGAFGFDRLPPAEYALTVNKTGFHGAQVRVHVMAGDPEPPVVKVALERDVASLPYISTLYLRGYTECQFFVVTTQSPTCGYALPDSVVQEKFRADYKLDELPMHIQGELAWEASTMAAQEMTLTYLCATCGGSRIIFGINDGASPVVTVVNMTRFDEADVKKQRYMQMSASATDLSGSDAVPDETVHGAYSQATGQDCLKYPNLPVSTTDACMRFDGVGGVVQQDFEVFTHVFYRFQPPEGWRFSSDGEPVVPE